MYASTCMYIYKSIYIYIYIYIYISFSIYLYMLLHIYIFIYMAGTDRETKNSGTACRDLIVRFLIARGTNVHKLLHPCMHIHICFIIYREKRRYVYIYGYMYIYIEAYMHVCFYMYVYI